MRGTGLAAWYPIVAVKAARSDMTRVIERAVAKVPGDEEGALGA